MLLYVTRHDKIKKQTPSDYQSERQKVPDKRNKNH